MSSTEGTEGLSNCAFSLWPGAPEQRLNGDLQTMSFAQRGATLIDMDVLDLTQRKSSGNVFYE